MKRKLKLAEAPVCRFDLLAVGLVLSAGCLAAEESYPQPPTPVPVPEEYALRVTPADAEVDSYIHVVAARNRFGVTGKGLAVAVIDGGINPYHLDFQNKIIATKNFSTENPTKPDDATDYDGHGSNVSSIIAGARTGPGGGINTGIAHEAKVAALKVFPGGDFSKINIALQWVLDNHATLGISVVNMSLGNNANETGLPADLHPQLQKQADLIGKLRQRNIAVVIAAGNGYYSNQSQQGMAFPGIVPACVSVGAIYDTQFIGGPGNPVRQYGDGSIVFSAYPGRCTTFSQRLGEQVGHEARTDVFAPGFFVTAAGAAQKGADGNIDLALSRYAQATQDGTSQATPVTSGLILLLQQRYRKLTAELGGDPLALPPVDLIEKCLRKGGVEFTDDEDQIGQQMDNVVSCGAKFVRIDAVGALEALDAEFHADSTQLAAKLFKAQDKVSQQRVLNDAKILNKSVLPANAASAPR